MFTSRWITFGSYCVMNFILGMHYFNIYGNIRALGPMIDDFTNDMFQYIYPVLYVILGPICYRIIWKSFFWANCFAWVCVITSVWLKFFSFEESPNEIPGHIMLVACTSLILPGTGVLAVKYFRPSEYFYVLTFASLSHLTGIIIGKVAKENLDMTTVFIIQGVVGTLVAMLFIVGSEPDPLVGRDEYESFFGSLKIMFKTVDRGVLFLAISAQFGFIYCFAIDFYDLYKLLFSRRKELDHWFASLYSTLFGVMGIAGGCLFIFVLKQTRYFGILARIYLGIPFMLIFLLNFVFRGPFFYTFLCVGTGLTILPSIGIIQIIGLSTHKRIIQPISINLCYYIGSFFMTVFRLAANTVGDHEYKFMGKRIYSSWVYNAFQFLILAFFFSVYDRSILKKFLGKS